MAEQVGIGMLKPGRSFVEQKMLLDITDLPSLEEPVLELGCGGDSTLGELGRLRLKNARRKIEGKAEINLVSTTVHPNLNINVQYLPPKNSIIMASGLNHPFPKNYF